MEFIARKNHKLTFCFKDNNIPLDLFQIKPQSYVVLQPCLCNTIFAPEYVGHSAKEVNGSYTYEHSHADTNNVGFLPGLT